MADKRMIMDEGDETPEETAQFELIPGVTLGIPGMKKTVTSRARQLLQPTDDEKPTPKTPE